MSYSNYAEEEPSTQCAVSVINTWQVYYKDVAVDEILRTNAYGVNGTVINHIYLAEFQFRN
jgi:hypothetical protein